VFEEVNLIYNNEFFIFITTLLMIDCTKRWMYANDSREWARVGTGHAIYSL
jgi:hypothetical protein